MKKLLVLFSLITLFLTSYGQQVVTRADFPGGIGKFDEYIQSHLQYPSDALQDSIQGEVFVKFIISTTGQVDQNQIQVLTNLSASCDLEAIRLIKNSPVWMPANLNGNAVIYEITFPVVFKLK